MSNNREFKDNFPKFFVHELKTPLNTIQSWVYVIKNKLKQYPDKGLFQAFEIIEKNISKQNKVIDSLVELYNLETGNVKLNVTTFDLIKAMNNQISLLVREYKNLQIKLVTEEKLLNISADYTLLTKIISYLLDNCIKFAKKDSLISNEIKILIKKSSSEAMIEIYDNGIGITDVFLPFAYDKFLQQDNSSSRKYEGLGIGLTITKKIIDLHNGQIVLQSPGDNKGTIATIILPINVQT